MSDTILFQGDCLEIMQHIPDKSVDMILCDLPYGTTACKWDVIIPFDKLWAAYERIIKDNGAIILFASQPFTSALGASKIELLKYSWVWEKSRPTGHLNAKHQPLTGFEDVLVFYKKKPLYNPQGLTQVNLVVKNSASDLRRNKNNVTSTVSGRLKESYTQTFSNYPRGILRFQSENNRVHPTQKPEALLEYLIKTYTNVNEVVLDNTMGSGSTGVACVNTQRNFIGIEKDDKYFAIAEDRIRDAVKERSLLDAEVPMPVANPGVAS